MALNDAAIRALKPKGRVFAVADEKGLCIEVVNRRANGTPYRRAKGTPFSRWRKVDRTRALALRAA
jgi:hypothetical protein